MLQAIKIKLYPTDEQKTYINQLIGCNRFIYNQCLNYKITEYQTNNKSTGLTNTNNYVKSLKTNYLWINDSHSKVIQQTLINLETAYTNFFRDLNKNDTGGTICKAADLLIENGANSVRAMITHPILSGKALDNIEKSKIKEIFVLDTIPLKIQHDKIKILSCSKMISKAIHKIEENKSLSSLFNK
jgi:transposase